jgi:hypothetical protein
VSRPFFIGLKTQQQRKDMSHFTTITTQIRDVQALADACAEMGLELLQNAEARGYGSQGQHGDWVIRLKGPYDIAVNRQANGTFGLSADLWDGHIDKEVGSNYGRLLQLYAVHKTAREARKRGLNVQRSSRTDGSIKLTIGGM